MQKVDNPAGPQIIKIGGKANGEEKEEVANVVVAVDLEILAVDMVDLVVVEKRRTKQHWII